MRKYVDEELLVDIGASSHETLAAQAIPCDYLDEILINHEHVDHFGDLASFRLGGTTMNQLQEAYVRDVATRAGLDSAFEP